MTPEYQILKHHGLGTDITVLVSHIHSLAMAVNLDGVHSAAINYSSTAGRHSKHEIRVMTKPCTATWHDSTHHTVDLPSSASTEEQRQQSLRSLSEVINVLTALLEQETPS